MTLTSTSTPSTSVGAPAITLTQWDFDHAPGSDFSVDASGPSATIRFTSPGAKNVAVRVTETGGGTAIATRTIVVNARPDGLVHGRAHKPREGHEITFASTSSDPDGPMAKQEWDLDGNGRYEKQGAVDHHEARKGSYRRAAPGDGLQGRDGTTLAGEGARQALSAPPDVSGRSATRDALGDPVVASRAGCRRRRP